MLKDILYFVKPASVMEEDKLPPLSHRNSLSPRPDSIPRMRSTSPPPNNSLSYQLPLVTSTSHGGTEKTKKPPPPMSTMNKKSMSPQNSTSLSTQFSTSANKRNMSPQNSMNLSPRIGISLITPSSTKKKAMFSAEYRHLRKSFEANYKKYRTKRKPDDEKSLAVGYQYWNTWVKKHNKTLTVRLTKREFQSFWKWFSSRIEGHNSVNGSGIEINRIVDDFIAFGICKSRSEASSLLTSIDADGNGSISFDEFITGLSSVTNMEQVITLRKFISSLDAIKKELQDSKDDTDKARDMLLRRRSTLQELPRTDTDSSLMSMDGVDIESALSLSWEEYAGDSLSLSASPLASEEDSEAFGSLVCVDLDTQLAAAANASDDKVHSSHASLGETTPVMEDRDDVGTRGSVGQV